MFFLARKAAFLKHLDHNLLNIKDLNFSKNKKYAQNDPDENFIVYTNFDFYSANEFHKSDSGSETFSIMHTNICSLEDNFDKLELLLYNLDHNLDITALTETWHVERKKTFVSLLHGIKKRRMWVLYLQYKSTQFGSKDIRDKIASLKQSG